MEKVAFDNAGVQRLLSSIYELPVADYQTEMQEILADFGIWLLKHFEFSAEQASYVEQLDPDYLFVLAKQVAAAISSQSSIELKQDPKDGDEGGKVIETERASKTVFTMADGYQFISHLEIRIRYVQ